MLKRVDRLAACSDLSLLLAAFEQAATWMPGLLCCWRPDCSVPHHQSFQLKGVLREKGLPRDRVRGEL
ncbi:MAG: hypothetical protein LLG00_09200 [Planctomycetaceae bacterium]|nr:hypothetical protein [Planctomycetaceae bacterium]